MSKDKEFKAKNKDLNFEKKQNPDTVLGRQNRDVVQKTDFSVSKKNRLYQSRQIENISDNVPVTDNSDISNTTENTAENVVTENTEFTVPKQSQTEKTVHISVTENVEIQSDIPPPIPKDERYNFQNATSESKQAFDIVNKNTDFKLGRQEEFPQGTQNTV